LSCEKKNPIVLPQKIEKEALEKMHTVAGQEYVTTVGTQNATGPYEVYGSMSGGYGFTAHFEDLTFTVPDDDRSYIARAFRNTDGSAFMKISKCPEGVGALKQRGGEQDAAPNR